MFDFLGTFFKYFFITLSSIYIYTKLNSTKSDKRQLALGMLFSSICSAVVCFTREHLSVLSLFCIVLFTSIFLKLSYKKTLENAVTFTIISVGISFAVYIFTAVIVATVIFYPIKNLVHNRSILNLWTDFFVGLFQLLVCNLLFRIKRFRKGLTSYESKLTSDSGIFISLSLLVLASLLNSNAPYSTALIIFITVSFIGLLLFLWWRKYIRNVYLEKISSRNTEILENALTEQKAAADELLKQNEELSKIIHRDNKIIPSMAMAVEEILSCQSADEQKEKSKALLCQLKVMTDERKGIVTQYEAKSKRLAKTGILSVDAGLGFLLCRAKEKQTDFDVSVTEGFDAILTSQISENDLNTLILDICENALIAASLSEKRSVFVVFGRDNAGFFINVYDSGEFFDEKVIEGLGKKRTTTHKKTGGSGIGLMTICELTKKYGASLVIDEAIDNDSYKKCVSVIFDGSKRICIKSKRRTLQRIAADRNDIDFEIYD